MELNLVQFLEEFKTSRRGRIIGRNCSIVDALGFAPVALLKKYGMTKQSAVISIRVIKESK